MSASGRGLPGAAQHPPTPLSQVSVRAHRHSQSCWLLEAFLSLLEALELVPEQLGKQRAQSRVHAMPALRGLPPTNMLSPRPSCPLYLLDLNVLLNSFCQI